MPGSVDWESIIKNKERRLVDQVNKFSGYSFTIRGGLEYYPELEIRNQRSHKIKVIFEELKQMQFQNS
ncbi:hypothetical protein L2E82_45841 [Cichorium intybus]|uniref:Uncharacterized protein n=1 Tax=Cichorium intybus TaxID=13427 RepID=A0ACB8ZTP1_CICIN|nr:hypothetical protein L2E82_45841 [Cichorium intybus]